MVKPPELPSCGPGKRSRAAMNSNVYRHCSAFTCADGPRFCSASFIFFAMTGPDPRKFNPPSRPRRFAPRATSGAIFPWPTSFRRCSSLAIPGRIRRRFASNQANPLPAGGAKSCNANKQVKSPDESGSHMKRPVIRGRLQGSAIPSPRAGRGFGQARPRN